MEKECGEYLSAWVREKREKALSGSSTLCLSPSDIGREISSLFLAWD
jgi:hypothetical protein